MSIIGAGPVKLADVSDYVFRGLEFESLERLHVEVGTQIRVTSVIDSERGRYSYELVCEPDWTFRVVRIESANDERALTIESDGKGEWTVDGEWRSDLDECIDVDMVVTPFTNTLPIRRLGMKVDDEADLHGGLGRLPESGGDGRPAALHAARADGRTGSTRSTATSRPT